MLHPNTNRGNPLGAAACTSALLATAALAAEIPFTARQISFQEDRVISVIAVDLDDDGDVDTVSACGHCIIWHQNRGEPTPSFSRRLVSFDVSQGLDVVASDIEAHGRVSL